MSDVSSDSLGRSDVGDVSSDSLGRSEVGNFSAMLIGCSDVSRPDFCRPDGTLCDEPYGSPIEIGVRRGVLLNARARYQRDANPAPAPRSRDSLGLSDSRDGTMRSFGRRDDGGSPTPDSSILLLKPRPKTRD